MVAVGMDLLVERTRQGGFRLAAQLFQFRHQCGEMHLHLVLKIAGTCGHLHYQERVRDPKRFVQVGTVQRLAQRLEVVADMVAGRLWQGAGLGAYRGDRGLEQLRDTLAHQHHGGHHRYPQLLAELFAVDVQPLLPGLVHHVQRDHHGAAQLAEFQGEFQVAFQCRGIDDLDDDIGRGERGRWSAWFVHRNRRLFVTPQQVLQGDQVVMFLVLQ